MIIIIVIIIIIQQEKDFKQIESPILMGRSIGRVTTPMRELWMLVLF
jgi:hypothetical protein